MASLVRKRTEEADYLNRAVEEWMDNVELFVRMRWFSVSWYTHGLNKITRVLLDDTNTLSYICTGCRVSWCTSGLNQVELLENRRFFYSIFYKSVLLYLDIIMLKEQLSL